MDFVRHIGLITTVIGDDHFGKSDFRPNLKKSADFPKKGIDIINILRINRCRDKKDCIFNNEYTGTSSYCTVWLLGPKA
jgi:hypothetical protein